MKTTKLVRLLALTAILLVLPVGAALAAQAAADQTGASPAIIKVVFRMDPRLTRGMYMGDRWVSPPNFTGVQEGKTLTVDARAEALDAKGTRLNISPTWTSADPEMVVVSPGQGNTVKITILRDGQSSLELAGPGYSKKLAVKATYRDNAIQAEIAQ